MTGTKYWSTFFPSEYPLNAMTIEKVWIVTNARAMIAVGLPAKYSSISCLQLLMSAKKKKKIVIHLPALKCASN